LLTYSCQFGQLAWPGGAIATSVIPESGYFTFGQT
jgi:hypothetical protein